MIDILETYRNNRTELKQELAGFMQDPVPLPSEQQGLDQTVYEIWRAAQSVHGFRKAMEALKNSKNANLSASDLSNTLIVSDLPRHYGLALAVELASRNADVYFCFPYAFTGESENPKEVPHESHYPLFTQTANVFAQAYMSAKSEFKSGAPTTPNDTSKTNSTYALMLDGARYPENSFDKEDIVTREHLPDAKKLKDLGIKSILFVVGQPTGEIHVGEGISTVNIINGRKNSLHDALNGWWARGLQIRKIGVMDDLKYDNVIGTSSKYFFESKILKNAKAAVVNNRGDQLLMDRFSLNYSQGNLLQRILGR